MPNQDSRLWRRPFILPLLIVVAALLVRLLALAYWGVGAIDSEGSEYARISENLRAGLGYVGMTSPGTQLTFAPGFPFLIAAASFFTHDYEWAGRCISLLFGALLPLPVYGIASRLFDRRTGLLAAGLAIFNPLLVVLSSRVLVEGVYTAMLLSAVYVVLRALERPSMARYCAVGAIFGLTFLTRQEAMGSFLVAVIITLLFAEGLLAARGKWAAAALAIFAIVVLPEAIFMYKATGELRLEGKSALIYAEELRTSVGQNNKEADPDEWALHSVDGNAERSGIANRPQADIVRETRVSPRNLGHIVKMGIKTNLPVLLEQLSATWLAGPVLLALALVGLVRLPWKRESAPSFLYVLLVPCVVVLATFSLTWFIARFYFVLVPFLLIWAASGLVGVGSWAKASLDETEWRSISGAARWVTVAVVASIVVVYPVKAVLRLPEFQQGSRATLAVKQTGLWIKQQQDYPVLIMDRGTPLAYHAASRWVAFPYASEDVALHFLDKEKVDYVILRQGEKSPAYYRDWFAKGIPDGRAKQVYVTRSMEGNEIRVYRWQWGNKTTDTIQQGK